MLKTQAIKRYLETYTHKDLADLYHAGMEVQVNAAQDGGERVGGSYMGKKWAGWSDGFQTWKSFRIPFKAMTDNPEYEDTELKWSFEEHCEAIGLTGWDWKNQRSIFVAYDFDAIAGHSEKHEKRLTDDELKKISDSASQIPWVTVRKSTSGSGIHLYVLLDIKDIILNHTEHMALSRAILSQMSALAGYNFTSSVDVCGSNMWFWARKMTGSDGLSLVKRGSKLTESPLNWRDHIDVAKGKSQRAINCRIKEAGASGAFEELCTSRATVKLDSEHRRLIKWLEDHDAIWSWDQGSNMITTHVYQLKKAHQELEMRGFFDTISQGSNLSEQNCFAYPLRGGSWVVRRFSPGCAEHETWDQDGRGWTRSYLNKEADLKMACRAFGGIEDAKGGFFFDQTERAIKAANLLGVHLRVHESMYYRACTLKPHKDNRLIVEVERQPNDSADLVPGFLSPKTKIWQKITDARLSTTKEVEVESMDDTIRHIVSEGHDSLGWVLECEGVWISEPVSHIERFLTSQGYKPPEIRNMLGQSIAKPWTMVNKPFKPEYPGGRQWNRKSAQLKYAASTGDHPRFPTWEKVLKHCGDGLTEGVLADKWCQANGILTGGEYLMYWISSMIQYPNEPLPYLFFYSKAQNTGKSTFHEVIDSILTSGCISASAAIVSSGGFNKELEGTVLCYVEEIDLANNKVAYNRIKDWVTSRQIAIHEKGGTPYQTRNTTHWCQMANSISHCPVFAGDTRIIVIPVASISPEDEIPKSILEKQINKEAPDFLQAVQSLEIPEPDTRLRIPVISTEEKALAEDKSKSELDTYIAVACSQVPGAILAFNEFYDRFVASLSSAEALKWSKNKVSRELDLPLVTGRTIGTTEISIGNLAWIDTPVDPSSKFTVQDRWLIKDGEKYDART